MYNSKLFPDQINSDLALVWHVRIMHTDTGQCKSGIVECKKPMTIVEVNNKYFYPKNYTVIDEVALFKIEQRN